MLNKPTNISPHNTFIDVNDGITFKFKLNNIVDKIRLLVYKSEDNSLVLNKLIYNTYEPTNEFTCELTDELSNFSNGTDYYWKIAYWNEPTITDETPSVNINYWNLETNSFGVELKTGTYQEIEYGFLGIAATEWGAFSGEDRVIHSSVEIKTDGTAKNNNNLDNLCSLYSEEATRPTNIYIRVGNRYYRITNVTSNGGASTSARYSICVNESLPEKISIGDSLYFYRLEEEFNGCQPGKYLYLSGELYKITSSNINFHDGICTIDIPLSKPLPDYFYDENTMYGGGVWDINAPITEISYLDDANYNESQPYFFSLRNNISNNTSIAQQSTPYLNTKFELTLNEVDTDYDLLNSIYSYNLYLLNNRSEWELIYQGKNQNYMTTQHTQTNGIKYYTTTPFTYYGLSPNKRYKLELSGQTAEGMEFKAENLFSTTDFAPNNVLDFVSFNRDLGCIEIDNSVFMVNGSSALLQIYRSNPFIDKIDYVDTIEYNINAVSAGELLRKVTKTYDFNILSDTEYTYYAFIFEDGVVTSSYKSNPITPSFEGAYIVDLKEEDNDVFIPDINNVWFIELNHESSSINRNYQIGHPIGVASKYPKATKGNSAFKTSSISGLIGKIDCKSSQGYKETQKTVYDWDKFCENNNPKLLRSSVHGENMIVSIDGMSTEVFAPSVTLTNFNYTQIGDIFDIRVNIEV